MRIIENMTNNYPSNISNHHILFSFFLMLIIIHFYINAQTQFPSPMVDYSRTHDRVNIEEVSGKQFVIQDILSKSIEVYFPEHSFGSDSLELLIHFHGPSFVPIYAIEISHKPYILANINLGNGSSVYEKAFMENNSLTNLINVIQDSMSIFLGENTRFTKIYLTGFSAGYGAIRAILKNSNLFQLVNGVILLDGLHTDYIPEKQVIANGGKLKTDKLSIFLELAKLAIEEDKIFVVTHSEIFPGTYGSTTETADYLIQESGLSRKAVLKWGVLGMQQTSEARKGNFIVLGFAGNSAPDHIDHFHALFEFLQYFE